MFMYYWNLLCEFGYFFLFVNLFYTMMSFIIRGYEYLSMDGEMMGWRKFVKFYLIGLVVFNAILIMGFFLC
jgi:hypothetical protein